MVPLTLGQEDTLTEPLALPDTVPDREPLSVPVPQAVADCDSLVLGVSVPDTLEQPDDVADAQLLADTEGLVEGLMVPLTVPLTVLVRLAVEQEDAEPDTLTLGLMVPDTVVQPLLVIEGELEEDTLGLPDGLVVRLTVRLLVPHTVAVMDADADCDTLVLGESVPDTLAHPEEVADAQLLGDTEGLPEAHWVPLLDTETVCVTETLGQDEPDTDTLWLSDSVLLTVLQMVGEVVTDEDEDSEREPDGEMVPLTLGQDEVLGVTLLVTHCELLWLPLAEELSDVLWLADSVPVMQAEEETLGQADAEAETLCVSLRVTLLQALTVCEAEAQALALRLGVAVCDALLQLLTVTDEQGEAVPLRDAEGEGESDTLRLLVRLPVVQAEAEVLGLPLSVPQVEAETLRDGVLLPHPVAMCVPEGDWEMLPERDGDWLPEELGQADGERVAESVPLVQPLPEREVVGLREEEGVKVPLLQPEADSVPESERLGEPEGRPEALTEEHEVALRDPVLL